MHSSSPSGRLLPTPSSWWRRPHGLALIASCDKIVPGMLMAAAMLDIRHHVRMAPRSAVWNSTAAKRRDLHARGAWHGSVGPITEEEFSARKPLRPQRAVLLLRHGKHHVPPCGSPGNDPAGLCLSRSPLRRPAWRARRAEVCRMVKDGSLPEDNQ